MSLEEIEELLSKDGYERRPYGWKKLLSAESWEIILLPGKDTASGMDEKELGKFGLRDHSYCEWERVKHLGYVDGAGDGEITLLYIFLDATNKVNQTTYKKDDLFYSVYPSDIGRWHALKNISNQSIRLLIECQSAR
ncbi:hypothetical protein [[Eubacterium] cellulosolvens]